MGRSYLSGISRDEHVCGASPEESVTCESHYETHLGKRFHLPGLVQQGVRIIPHAHKSSVALGMRKIHGIIRIVVT